MLTGYWGIRSDDDGDGEKEGGMDGVQDAIRAAIFRQCPRRLLECERGNE